MKENEIVEQVARGKGIGVTIIHASTVTRRRPGGHLRRASTATELPRVPVSACVVNLHEIGVDDLSVPLAYLVLVALDTVELLFVAHYHFQM